MGRRISTILLIVLLVGVGLCGLRGSGVDHLLAGPGPRLLPDAPWTANAKVNDDLGPADQYSPDIAVDSSGNAYAVWSDKRNGNYDIYFSYLPFGGSWTTNVKVNDDPGQFAWADQDSPDIAVDPSGNAYAVWSDYRTENYDVYFSYRPAGGSWGTNVTVNDYGSWFRRPSPAIAVDSSGNAYAIWSKYMSGGIGSIYFSYRPAGGSWGTNVTVNQPWCTFQVSPDIAVDASGNAYAVWPYFLDNDFDIYFSYRPAGGSWGTNVKVSDDPGTATQSFPSIAVDASGNAYAVWGDGRNGNGDVYFAYRPAGSTWGANIRVDDDAGTASQWYPSIGVDSSGNAYAVWRDGRNGNSDIYFSYLPEEGLTPTPTPTFTPTPTPTPTFTPTPTPPVYDIYLPLILKNY